MDETLCLTPVGLALFWLGNSSQECIEILSILVTTTDATFSVYIKYFLSTFALELPIYTLFLRGKNITKIVGITILLNLLTHPIIFYVFPYILERSHATYGTYLLTAELFAPLVEAVALSKLGNLSLKKCAIVALAANLFSWWLGIYLLH